MPSICSLSADCEPNCASITPTKRKLRSASKADYNSPPASAFRNGVLLTPIRRKLRSSPAADSKSPNLAEGDDAFVTPKRNLRSSLIEEFSCHNSLSPAKRTPSRRTVDFTPSKLAKEKQESVPGKTYGKFLDVANWSPAKNAMHVSTVPSTVICREEEQRKILEFCQESVTSEKAGSLYVCGLPGTGKSLSMETVKKQLLEWVRENNLHRPEFATLNCTSLTNPAEIFSKITENFNLNPKTKTNPSTTPLQCLQNMFSHKNPSRMMFIIADELDYLATADKVVLHELFMLTSYKFSKCILIGVANSIDLADRFLPKLQPFKCKPKVITFKAYTVDQIKRILQDRIKDVPCVTFDPQALELCARKVASGTGDMRVALAVCRSAIDIMESEVRSEPGDRTTERPIVRVDHMANALSKAFKSSVVDTIKSLPLHQQVILYSAVKCSQLNKDSNTSQLNKVYLEACKSINDYPNSTWEFMAMCRVLSDQGLLTLASARKEKSMRYTLKVEGADVIFALQGVRLFRNCFS